MMASTFLCSLLSISAMLSTALAKTGPSHDKIVVCYLATWAVYREGKGSYGIDNFDPDLCTHVVYAFSGLDVQRDAIRSLDPWQDLKDDYGKDGYGHLVGLRKTHPHLKVTLAIGGWNEGSKNYSMLAANPERRQRFVKNSLEFVQKYNFDGLDLDWEYPTQRGGEPKDRKNFVALVKELRSTFSKHNLLLTSAIGAGKKTIDEAYDIANLSNLLDFMHIMCYDYGGSWDKKVTANAPLASDDFLNVEYTIEYLIKLGASPSKLVMGLPFYGRTFVTPRDGYLGDEAEPIGFAGPLTKENGFLGYNEICTLLSNSSSGWTTAWDAATSQGVAKYRDMDKGETRVVTYDTTRSIAIKIRFAMKHNLAGAMVWSVDTDDFLGECDSDTDTYADYSTADPGVKITIPHRVNTNYPLLRTINEGILLALDEIDQENAIREREKENEIPHGSEEDNSAGSTSGSVKLCWSIVLFTIFIKLCWT